MKKRELVTVLSIAIGVFLVPVAGQAGRILSSVQIEPLRIDVSKNETVSLNWHQSEKGRMNVYICNLNGVVVKTLLNQVEGQPGTNKAAWDGRDETGELCPNGAYIPIIKVQTRKRGSDIFNPTFSPWGLRLSNEEISFDPETKKISYRLSGPALCQIRAGSKKGGPCYKTLTDWEPKASGDHQLSWDGLDASAVLNAWEINHFALVLDAFSVPEEAILLTGSATSSRILTRMSKRFPIKPPHGGQIFLHAMHRRDLCHDMSIQAAFSPSKVAKDGRTVLTGQARLLVSAGPDVDSNLLQRESFEIYLFCDGQLLSEGPQSELPAAITFDTTTISNGKHMITVNFRTSEDHLGAYSMKVLVQN